MRGQVVIQEISPQASAVLWTPAPGLRDVETHTGRVLAMGPPARTPTGAEVEHGFVVGDLVQYHFTHLEEAATNTWNGEKAVWVPQQNVDGVWEEPCEACAGKGYDSMWEEKCDDCNGRGTA